MSEEQIDWIENKFRFYDKLIWAVLAVAMMLGLAGTVGWTRLSSTQEKLEEILARIESIDKKAESSMAQISRAEKRAVEQIRTQEEALIDKIYGEQGKARLMEFLRSGSYELKSKSVSIVGNDGKIRLRIGADENDLGSIHLYNGMGNIAVEVGIRSTSPHGIIRMFGFVPKTVNQKLIESQSKGEGIPIEFLQEYRSQYISALRLGVDHSGGFLGLLDINGEERLVRK